MLITGGTGGLGALLARHLVPRTACGTCCWQPARPAGAGRGRAGGGAGRAGRRGDGRGVRRAPTARSCEALLDAIPAEHPLSAVVHAAGVLDDGVIESLTAERVERVLAPKVDAALAPARADRGAGPAGVRAVLLGRGHARQRRPGQLRGGERVPGRARGAPPRAGPAGVSLAWGLWAQDSGDDAAGSAEAERARIARSGMRRALRREQGLELFDARA